MSSERYTIVVSGERFIFTRDQIESDPGNRFATFFFGESSEGVRGFRELSIEKDAQLFKIIQAHLRSYVFLPLADTAIPSYMTREAALTNLLNEARYYGLQNLEEKILSSQSSIAWPGGDVVMRQPQRAVARRYKFAKFNAGEWVVNDTTPEGYQIILARFVNDPEKRLMANNRLHYPGFTQVVCWRDKADGGSCALLVSDPAT